MRRGKLVETVQPDVGGMIIQGQGTGCPFRYYARYVVAADGARSLMRKAAETFAMGFSDTLKNPLCGKLDVSLPRANSSRLAADV
jgi:2-polyprenyl-6-methoxyphenol hydroxylase-like FAD-dependent oxidoreductase